MQSAASMMFATLALAGCMGSATGGVGGDDDPFDGTPASTAEIATFLNLLDDGEETISAVDAGSVTGSAIYSGQVLISDENGGSFVASGQTLFGEFVADVSFDDATSVDAVLEDFAFYDTSAVTDAEVSANDISLDGEIAGEFRGNGEVTFFQEDEAFDPFVDGSPFQLTGSLSGDSPAGESFALEGTIDAVFGPVSDGNEVLLLGGLQGTLDVTQGNEAPNSVGVVGLALGTSE